VVDAPTVEVIEDMPSASPTVSAKPAPVEVAAAVEDMAPILPAPPAVPQPLLAVDAPTVEVIEDMPSASPTVIPQPAPVEIAAAVEDMAPVLPAPPVVPQPPLAVDAPTAEAIEETPPASPATEASTPPVIQKPEPVEIAAAEKPAPVLPAPPVVPQPPLVVDAPTAEAIEETPPASPPETTRSGPVEIAAVEKPAPVPAAEPPLPKMPLVIEPTTAEVIEETPPASPAVEGSTLPVAAKPEAVETAAVEIPAPVLAAEPVVTPPPSIRVAVAETTPHAESRVEIARVPPSPSVQEPAVAATPAAPLLPSLGQSERLGKALDSAKGGAGGSCVRKNRGAVVFCVEAIDWPADVKEFFDTSTLMYRGAKAIVRYDGDEASGFHTLFHSQDFDAVVRHFKNLLGQPSATPERRIAPMAKPRQANPTRIWRIGGEAGGAVLEVRRFDDARGGFPDTKHGVVLLGRTPVRVIFPHLSSLDLMMVR
jgi:hypothetical protein